MRRLCLVLVPLLALAACDKKPEAPKPSPAPVKGAPTPAPQPPAAPAGDGDYTVRGKIISLPDGQSKPLVIHHEDIAGFKIKSGEVQPMKSHEMGFQHLGPGVSVTALKAGDPVEFTFQVRWNETWIYRISAIKALPADTVLKLSSEAATPAPAPAPAPPKPAPTPSPTPAPSPNGEKPKNVDPK